MAIVARFENHLAAALLDQQDLKKIAVAMRENGPIVNRRARRDGLDVDEVECLIVRRIAVEMKQRQCGDRAHCPRIVPAQRTGKSPQGVAAAQSCTSNPKAVAPPFRRGQPLQNIESLSGVSGSGRPAGRLGRPAGRAALARLLLLLARLLLAAAALLLAALAGLLALLARTLCSGFWLGFAIFEYSTELHVRPMPIGSNAWEPR